MTPTALSQFLLGVAGVAYGTALFLQPGVLRTVAVRLFGARERELTATEGRVRRLAGAALVAAGMYLLAFP